MKDLHSQCGQALGQLDLTQLTTGIKRLSTDLFEILGKLHPLKRTAFGKSPFTDLRYAFGYHDLTQSNAFVEYPKTDTLKSLGDLHTGKNGASAENTVIHNSDGRRN